MKKLFLNLFILASMSALSLTTEYKINQYINNDSRYIDIGTLNFPKTINIRNIENVKESELSEYIWMYISANVDNNASAMIDTINSHPEFFEIVGNKFKIPATGCSNNYNLIIKGLENTQINENVIYKGTAKIIVTLTNSSKQKNDITNLQPEIDTLFNKNLNLINNNGSSYVKYYNKIDKALNSYEKKLFNEENIFTKLFKINAIKITFDSEEKNDFIKIQNNVRIETTKNQEFIGSIYFNKIVYSEQRLLKLCEYKSATNTIINLENNTIDDLNNPEYVKNLSFNEAQKLIYKIKDVYVGLDKNKNPLSSIFNKYVNYLNINLNQCDQDNVSYINFQLKITPCLGDLSSPFITNTNCNELIFNIHATYSS